MKSTRFLSLFLSVALLLTSAPTWAASPAAVLPPEGTTPVGAADSPPAGPLMFVENVGQFDPSASSGQAPSASSHGELVEPSGQGVRPRFQVYGGDRTVWLADDGIWVSVSRPVEREEGVRGEIAGARALAEPSQERPGRFEAVHLKLRFVGANPHPRLEPSNRLDTRVSYFIGADPDNWHADVPAWGGVRYVDLYPGLDLEIAGGESWSWRIASRAPEADLSAVRLRIEGAEGLVLDHGRGLIQVETPLGHFRLPLLQTAGVVSPQGLVPWLESGQEIVTPFADAVSTGLNARAPAGVTDIPEDLLYATFLGGGGNDGGDDIAVGGVGAAYVTGFTASLDFPAATGPGYDTSPNGSLDAFVVKLAPDGISLAYATFLGGGSDDYGHDIGIDSTGAAYVTGRTDSADFPAAGGPGYDTSHNGGGDGFVVKLTADGTGLAYATFLGGSAYDDGDAIAVDATGVYISGDTDSDDFPAADGPGYDTSHNGGRDAFVVKLAPDGMALVYATFLGGASEDDGDDVVVDGTGAAYVSGHTASAGFPAAEGPGYDTSHNGGMDAFLAKLVPAGTSLVYATFLGGSSLDNGNFISVDGAGAAYVTGWTESSDFPAASGPGYDTTLNGGADAFVVKLTPAGTGVTYATFLGGASDDWGVDTAVDGTGAVYVSGWTSSAAFPATQGPGYDTSHNGGVDGFLVKLAPAGTALVYATFLGGSGDDVVYGMAVGGSGAAYVVGSTVSADLVAAGPGYDTTYNGGNGDGFVVKLAVGGTMVPLDQHLYLPLVLRGG